MFQSIKETPWTFSFVEKIQPKTQAARTEPGGTHPVTRLLTRQALTPALCTMYTMYP